MSQCAMCGKEFTPSSPKQVYCHRNCSQKAYEGRKGLRVRDWFEPTRLESFYIDEQTRRAERNRARQKAAGF